MSRYTDAMLETAAIPSAVLAPVHAEPGDTYAMPASAGQVRFWSLDQLNPGNPALNMPLMWKCTGPLNAQAMQQAFTRCVERHEILRTTFALHRGQLSQIIHPPAAVEIPIVDLSGLAGEQRTLEADAVTRAHAAFRFDLEGGPLLKLKLLRLTEQDYVLLVTMHHIICDGISLGILLRDMATHYDSIVTHAPAALPELPIQFADFAVWQQEWLAGDEPERSLAFWRESVGNDFSRVALPRDADAISQLAGRREHWTGDIETLLIPPALQARAHAFCQRENVTLNILLFSVFAALLRRLTGQLDLTIGSPCANRTEESAELIGLFMNIQVMRLRLAEDESFRQLLTKVQDWTLGAYENQELPFENLVHDPFFSEGAASLEMPIFFLYQKSFMVTHQVGGLEIVPLRSESPGAVFEMFFAIVDRAEEGPRLQLEYNPRYFKLATVQRYLRMYVELLASALNQPAAQVDELNMLALEDRTEAVVEGNRTAVDFGPFASVPASFLRRAAHTPDAVAFECKSMPWTCVQLADYAHAVAQTLLDKGLAPGDLVGICVDRTPQMIGAVLAVMMAGGAFVPLDPRHPTERLETILDDAGARFLLVTQAPKFRTTACVLDLLEDHPASAMHTLPTIASTDLAYVIYTSGSTGKPKGVAVEHGALVNLLHAMQQTPGLTADDTLVAITTLAFDIALLELLLPLVTGARLVLATEAEVQDGRELCTLLERTAATVLQATPGAWRILLDSGWEGNRSFKALCGGESLPRGLADELLDRTGELWNMYGPTETTIWSSALRVERGHNPVAVGGPIANTQFYVLDQHLNPQPIGTTGELYIGGTGLARGYWNNPDLTAKKFINAPAHLASG